MKVISSDLLRGHIDTFVLSALMSGTKYGNEIRKFITQKQIIYTCLMNRVCIPHTTVWKIWSA